VEELVSLLQEKPSSRLRPGEVTTCVTTWGPPKDGLDSFVEK
jgi:acylphosphatase